MTEVMLQVDFFEQAAGSLDHLSDKVNACALGGEIAASTKDVHLIALQQNIEGRKPFPLGRVPVPK